MWLKPIFSLVSFRRTDPKVAKVIADQTGAEMMLLHGAHNVSKDELNAGISYIKIVTTPWESLKADQIIAIAEQDANTMLENQIAVPKVVLQRHHSSR